MFNAIAPRYDLLNGILSLGMDRYWRRRAIRALGDQRGSRILDVATGTGDVALGSLRLAPAEVVGVDIAEAMLDLARVKARRHRRGEAASFTVGAAESLPFEDNTFNAAIVAFGVRNFANLDRGLAELNRVLLPGSVLVVLEFSQPRAPGIRQIYHQYGRWVLPRVGRALSHVEGPYQYLPDSIRAFPSGDAFLERMCAGGFLQTQAEPLTFGIATVYSGRASRSAGMRPS